jgi:hypothetical protein
MDVLLVLRVGTRAVDIDCPKCGRAAGTVCNGEGIGADMCQARINAAVKVTRERNRALRTRKRAGD